MLGVFGLLWTVMHACWLLCAEPAEEKEEEKEEQETPAPVAPTPTDTFNDVHEADLQNNATVQQSASDLEESSLSHSQVCQRSETFDMSSALFWSSAWCWAMIEAGKWWKKAGCNK